MKHAHEIALEGKKKQSEDININDLVYAINKKLDLTTEDIESRLNCLENFLTTTDIEELIGKIDRASGIQHEIILKMNDNFSKVNTMMLEVKGVISMARSAVSERNECKTMKCCGSSSKGNFNQNETIKLIASENEFYKKTILSTIKEIKKKVETPWYKFW